ncbi:MAG: carboxypeptidase regulatory-like domain-containing protein [Planctomycetes bacterium]|nr:carboxypeptidase regulatory-like domain-containing protein [Planctomycetota bacterium]
MKPRAVILACLALLAVGLALGYLFSGGAPHDVESDTPRADTELGPAGESGGSPPLDSPSSAVPCAGRVEFEEAATGPAGHGCLFTISCRDAEGRPIAGVSLTIRGWFAEPSLDHIEARSDEHGAVEVLLATWSSVDVYSTASSWTGEARLTCSEGNRNGTLLLKPCASFEVWVQTDEGTPYYGPSTLSAGDRVFAQWATPRLFMLKIPRDDDSWQRPLMFDGQGPIRLTRIPVDRDACLTTEHTSLGYTTQTFVVPRHDMVDGARLTYTISRDPKDKCGLIELDVSGHATGADPSHKTIMGYWAAISMPVANFYHRSGGLWVSRPVPPGTYTVEFQERGVVIWASQPVVVTEREVTRVKYEPYDGCTVTVRACDATGAPVRGAVLSRSVGTYVSWLAGPPEGAAVSSAEGLVEIKGLPPGHLEFVVEAEGYEPSRFAVDLVDGVTHRHPDIYLEPAVGRVELTLEGMSEDVDYTVMLVQPGGQPVAAIGDVRNSQQCFEKLPLREYVVAVIAGRGGLVISRDVTLASGSETAKLTLDVSSLKAE